MGKISKKMIKSTLLIILWLWFASVVRALGIYVFIEPNGFAPSGFTGIAVMIKSIFNISSAYVLILLNVPVLILGFFVLDIKFTLKTIFFIVMQSAMLLLIEKIDQTFIKGLIYVSEQGKMLAAIFGGVLLGIGLAMVLRVGGSTGGTDVIGIIIQKRRPDINVSWIICFLDMIVILASFFVYSSGIDSVLYALICTYLLGKTSNLFLKGIEERITLQIYGENFDDGLIQDLMSVNRTHVYFSKNTGGAYIVCTFRKINLCKVKKILKKYSNIKTYLVESQVIK